MEIRVSTIATKILGRRNLLRSVNVRKAIVIWIFSYFRYAFDRPKFSWVDSIIKISASIVLAFKHDMIFKFFTRSLFECVHCCEVVYSIVALESVGAYAR